MNKFMSSLFRLLGSPQHGSSLSSTRFLHDAHHAQVWRSYIPAIVSVTTKPKIPERTEDPSVKVLRFDRSFNGGATVRVALMCSLESQKIYVNKNSISISGFRFTLATKFNFTPENIELLYLPPKGLWEDMLKITTTIELTRILNEILSPRSDDEPCCLFVNDLREFTEDTLAPVTTPALALQDIANVRNLINSSKALDRDGNQCACCGGQESLRTVRILPNNHMLVAGQLAKLKITSSKDLRNLFTACENCHAHYDRKLPLHRSGRHHDQAHELPSHALLHRRNCTLSNCCTYAYEVQHDCDEVDYGDPVPICMPPSSTASSEDGGEDTQLQLMAEALVNLRVTDTTNQRVSVDRQCTNETLALDSSEAPGAVQAAGDKLSRKSRRFSASELLSDIWRVTRRASFGGRRGLSRTSKVLPTASN